MIYIVKGFSNQQGILAALIPILLVMLNLMVGITFGATAVIFVIAIVFQVFPDQVAFASKVIDQQVQTITQHSKPQ